MARLIESLVDALPAGIVKLRHRVTRVIQDRRKWVVEVTTETGGEARAFDAVIIAAGAPAAARMFSGLLAAKLGEIETAGASVVCLGFRREQVLHPLDAFGFVVPQIEGRRILAGSFLSTKFADRTPYNGVLMRIFVGGALQPELVDLPDDELFEIVDRELQSLLGVSGKPQVVDISRWHGAMPQYGLGHLQLVDEIERLVGEVPGLELAGNAYRGVGIAPCVKSGEVAARRVFEFLGR
jgi:oxygen-dependent protoporphyrinogen oxidase